MRYPEIENTAEGIPLIYSRRIVKIWIIEIGKVKLKLLKKPKIKLFWRKLGISKKLKKIFDELSKKNFSFTKAVDNCGTTIGSNEKSRIHWKLII